LYNDIIGCILRYIRLGKCWYCETWQCSWTDVW